MFELWKKLESHQHVIRILWGVVALLVVINLCLFWGWKTSPSRMTVYIPPDITQGVVEKPNQIPNTDVYAFAFQVFTTLNTWSFDGTKDYSQAIDNYRYYLTTQFYGALNADEKSREADGSLERTRIMTGYTGMGYQDNSVKVLGANTWEVILNLRVVEQVGNTVVKDVLIQYPLRVVRTQMSTALNPWGLAIDGFVSEPVRLKTFI